MAKDIPLERGFYKSDSINEKNYDPPVGFLGENFMLTTETARKLYGDYARSLPIIDYHCHISPAEIASDRRYENLAQIWLTCGDHYKWRAVRTAGFSENLVTGDSADCEKFAAWAATIPDCIGNPLYIWTHMELRKYFGYTSNLSPATADEVWKLCNEKLNSPDMSARSIMRNSNVRLICTTDDPADSLEHHKAIAEDSSFDISVLPAFRPDKGVHIEKDGFAEYIRTLGKSAGQEIANYDDLLSVYVKRIGHFEANGCRTADHGFEAVPFRREGNGITPERVFERALKGAALSFEEAEVYKTELTLFLAREYQKRGWVWQIHVGVSRNNSKRLLRIYGPDSGGDAIGGFNCVYALTCLLSALDADGVLPKTVLYSVNPSDNAALDSVIGCFQDGETRGKIQHGSAWWFNDNNTGMRGHMTSLAENGLLPCFIGMLTDSRSFLSYTRHDYFRRILCDILGKYAENGEYPSDLPYLGKMAENICFSNANNYFGFKLN